jgi:hypothetical protein
VLQFGLISAKWSFTDAGGHTISDGNTVAGKFNNSFYLPIPAGCAG